MKRGIGIATYNRSSQIAKVIRDVQRTMPKDCRLVVADDETLDFPLLDVPSGVTYIVGDNQGVGANKNRLLFALQDCDFICILEDDLIPTREGWFENYERFVISTNIHHLCRVQDKEVPECNQDFGDWVKGNINLTPIYGSTPRGDLTFISNLVLRKVGAFDPRFKGVGHAHGQWSDRVWAAGLIEHPNKWIDIKECRDAFEQIGDTEGSWRTEDNAVIKRQISDNQLLRKTIGTNPLYVPIFLP